MKTLDPTTATVRETDAYARHQYLLAAADSDAERNEAYRIRHTAYVAQGYIASHPSGQFSDDYDREQNCPSWLLYRQGKAVGSIRICIHLGMEGWNRMPCREVFSDVIEASFPPHLRLVELSRISVAGGAADRMAILALCSSAPCVADRLGCDAILAAFREEHFSFYAHLKFERLCPPRSYPGVNFPTILAVLNTRHALFRHCFKCPWDDRGVLGTAPGHP